MDKNKSRNSNTGHNPFREKLMREYGDAIPFLSRYHYLNHIKEVSPEEWEKILSKTGLGRYDVFAGPLFDNITLVAVCVHLAKKYGSINLMGSKHISEYELPEEIEIQSEDLIFEHPVFRNMKLRVETKIEISWYEALSISFVSFYISKWLTDHTVYIITNLDDTHLAIKELALSDGVLAYVPKNAQLPSVLPYSHVYQQVSYNNMSEDKFKKNITNEIIKTIESKTSRRQTYAVKCGLVVSVFSNKSKFDLKRIIRDSSAHKFYPSFLIHYKNSKRGGVEVSIYPIYSTLLDFRPFWLAKRAYGHRERFKQMPQFKTLK